jgi:S-adenosylmethionine synthase
VSVFVDTYGKSHVQLSDGEIAEKIKSLFSLRPHDIEQRLKLRHPIYEETARYGHVGRSNRVVTKTFHPRGQAPVSLEVELFTWEKLDRVDDIRQAFGLN